MQLKKERGNVLRVQVPSQYALVAVYIPHCP
jgi:hypothetical protein